MAMQLRYAGEFLSQLGNAWRCEILQEAESAFSSVGELTFPANEPLVIEWPEKAKYEPLCGSTATLTLVSPGDRSYIDLYTVKPGAIRLDVYKAGALFWSGCLDPEFYEEPYDRLDGYEVTLTFSDFGMLDRIPNTLTGMPTLADVISGAMAAANLAHLGSGGYTRLSTYFTDGVKVTPETIAVSADNFTDEDGVRSSWAEVLTGMLQPLALRMVQRGGSVHLYDINGLVLSGDPMDVEWTATGQTLGTDAVYNNALVTFSPYGRAALTDEVEYTGKAGPEWTNLGKDLTLVKWWNSAVPSGMTAPACWSYYAAMAGGDNDYAAIDFTIFASETEGSGLAYKGSGSRYFSLQGVLGSADGQGLAWGFYAGHTSLGDTSSPPALIGNDPSLTGMTVAMRTAGVWLPALSSGESNRWWVRLRLEMLASMRYNPFSGEDENNGDRIEDHFAYIGLKVVLRDAEGTALYHWSNEDICRSGAAPDYIANLTGEWVEGDAPTAEPKAWLMYYPNDGSYLGEGFSTNRQAFGPVAIGQEGGVWTSSIEGGKESFFSMPDGQYICYPPVAGYLEVSVMRGVYFRGIQSGPYDDDTSGIPERLRWLLYKSPALSICRRSASVPVEASELVEDLEYSGTLNEDAQEELGIDTICGTMPGAGPAARGVLVRVSDGSQPEQMQRADVTDSPEQLLIGTLYSQYAERHTTLTGEMRLKGTRPATWADAAQPSGRVFIALSERMDCIAEVEEAKLCEATADEYQGE